MSPSSGGWGKSTSADDRRPIDVLRHDVVSDSQIAINERYGDQKASSATHGIRQVAAFQQQARAPKPLTADQRIRNHQQGDQKPGANPIVFRDSNLRPVANIVHTIPQEVPVVLPPAPEPVRQPVLPSPVPQYVDAPVYQDHVVPYYVQPNHNGSYRCDACSRNQSSDWISLEALIWWTRDVSTPPLVTTSPVGTAPNVAGVAGANSDVVFGGDDQLFGFPQAGFRARLGHWNDVDEVSGFELEFLMLFNKGDNFFGRSDGSRILARPFTNVSGGQPVGGIQDAQLIAFPGLASGTISVNAETRFYGAGARYLHEIYLEEESIDDCGEVFGERVNHDPDSRVYLTMGPRFYHLDDSIEIREELTSVASGNEFLLVDSFQTENSFLGGEFGLRARRRRGRLQADLGLAIGIGATRQESDISGSTRIRSATGGAEFTNGFLAQPTNIGNYEDTVFSIVPRLEVGLDWEFAEGWSATVGYNLLYWTDVLRAGEQIDGTVNADLLAPAIVGGTGANRPAATLSESDYLAHGISFGIERRF
ncbi:MAG: BBP7 family outer membrane beta-barrel protein [Fuerstiella sp.]